jgi:hypothetical protein
VKGWSRKSSGGKDSNSHLYIDHLFFFAKKPRSFYPSTKDARIAVPLIYICLQVNGSPPQNAGSSLTILNCHGYGCA